MIISTGRASEEENVRFVTTRGECTMDKIHVCEAHRNAKIHECDADCCVAVLSSFSVVDTRITILRLNAELFALTKQIKDIRSIVIEG